MLLKETDIDKNLIDYFSQLTNISNKTIVNDILQFILVCTGGQIFLFFALSEHLLLNYKDKCLQHNNEQSIESIFDNEFSQTNFYKNLVEKSFQIQTNYK